MGSNVSLQYQADLERLETWVKYQAKMCKTCKGTCCTMPVEVKVGDLVRMGLVDAFEAEEQPKVIAKRLQKAGVIAHFNFKHSIFTLAQRSNAECIYLDSQTRLCSIYEKRPNTCRNHPQVGPRPGFCAYQSHPNSSR